MSAHDPADCKEGLMSQYQIWVLNMMKKMYLVHLKKLSF